VVTDEQHRFGVKQRQRLSEKGEMPHVLIMSATPIPRTLAIILYADMDISVIKELPAGRKPIKNCVVGTEYRNTAYGFIKRQVQEGHQAYVICPMVEESEALEAENVIDYADTLKQALGPGISVSYLHGKMKEGEKSGILQDFVQGRIQVLVSTTVIEVGINNPNATLMMIENAERFGLAQLHQLRGRVGRGDAQSYCIFINAKKSKESMERLQVLENSNDGFYIASEDLKLRGPGDFFGIRQSGDIMFQLADIYNHADMLKTAQEVAINYGDSLQMEAVGNVPITTL
jgi:ATP-dependent DNA helicase RecG